MMLPAVRLAVSNCMLPLLAKIGDVGSTAHLAVSNRAVPTVQPHQRGARGPSAEACSPDRALFSVLRRSPELRWETSHRPVESSWG